MKKFGFLSISTIILVVSVIFLSVVITQQLTAYKSKKEEIAAELNFEKRLMNAWEWIPGSTVGEQKVKQWMQLEEEAKAHYNGGLLYGGILAVILVLFASFNFLHYRNKPHQWQARGLVMIISAVSLLFLGLQSPLMEIHAYSKDLAFSFPIDINLNEMDYIGQLGLGEYHYNYERVVEGRTYYLYQNKSIFQLIALLYSGGNFLVAIILILFSVVFPLVKLITSVFVLIHPQKLRSAKLYNRIKNLGKWSMADVFVAAIFLALFSYANMNVGIDTGTATLIGTYFYLAFVILSISSGLYLKKAMVMSTQQAA